MAAHASPKDAWDSHTYSVKVAPFVASLTEVLVSWLDPQPTDEILDIGCGDGVLTAHLAQRVSSIAGIDSSPNMISAAQRNYPTIPFREVDCRYLGDQHDLQQGTFTKLFSNAALHWILRDATTRKDVMASCFKALRPGGSFVSESGGFGCVNEVIAALTLALVNRGLSASRVREAWPWYFADVEDMRELMTGAGFEWVKGELVLRQTKLTEVKGGGIHEWLRLFCSQILGLLPGIEQREEVIQEVSAALEGPCCRTYDGSFYLNYVRMRFIARKPMLDGQESA